MPQEFSAHSHLKVILPAIVINAPCELAYLLLNRIMNYLLIRLSANLIEPRPIQGLNMF